jgi:K+-sensing histidine kinase KdpD
LKDLYDKYNLDQFRANRERVALLLNVREAFKKAKIIADKQRLSRALSCLIENALAQTKKGVVEFGASFADKNILVFTIKDSSSMLLQDKIRTIFETTEKEEDWYNTTDTIGLGYKLASGLVKSMNGEIIVNESSFKGITIEFTIPVKMATPKHYRSGEEKRIAVERSQEE